MNWEYIGYTSDLLGIFGFIVSVITGILSFIINDRTKKTRNRENLLKLSQPILGRLETLRLSSIDNAAGFFAFTDECYNLMNKLLALDYFSKKNIKKIENTKETFKKDFDKKINYSHMLSDIIAIINKEIL